MKAKNFARIMIAGTGSGCGKTTITCGILKALAGRNLKTVAFKCGPDYIDPMFHTKIVGTESRNLDTFLCGENAVKYLFDRSGQNADISIVEGVMGFYDGLGNDDSHSSNALARITGTPVVLVVNPGGMSLSIAAMLKGYTEFIPNNIKGVIINNIPKELYLMYKEMIETHLPMKVLGFLPPLPEAAIESRHLGLVTADEIDNLQHKISMLGDNVEKYIDLDSLLELAGTAAPFEYTDIDIPEKYPCRIAVAKDQAFCFYYRDSLELLERLGSELIFFSPLHDKALPENIGGLILGGGYPELYAQELSENKNMLMDIKRAVNNGMPVYAECGGFMFLQQAIADMNGGVFPMVGVIKGRSTLQNRLSRFGYAGLKAKRDNLFCASGDCINAHEFHYYDSENNGDAFIAEKPDSRVKWDCIFATDTLFAGYPHIHFYGNINFAKRFVKKCSETSQMDSYYK